MLELSIAFPIQVQNGGLFISRGVGSHPARTLTSWEVIFVERGQLQIREDDRLFTVQAGESLLLRPGHRHVGEGAFPADLKFYWLHFDWLKGMGETGLHPAHLDIPQYTRVSDPQYVISLFRQFLSEQENIHRSIALECILLLILQQIAAPAAQESANDSPGLALAWKAHQIIRTQFHLPLSTSSLAKELHCNADYLGRVYRRTFRLTLTEALHRQRVLMAEKLLINNSLSLTEVGRQCGFNDTSYFRQIFRKHTGLTPAGWKRRYCKEHINS
ncbi:AraC family transcriptional regulator [Pantoea sp. At-9b]|uniref:helix-turn-helix domain-containing protein n=1 Tax=Pantoea sp. (strain At-9b) TaxID=592316 RepID=UPI0001B3E591|nr:AraC family transcriptional regulator [Pantoea sp. At-9b]ADU69979.1 transcriptional regulator, AraC family [Pantoea sp. At-9b]